MSKSGKGEDQKNKYSKSNNMFNKPNSSLTSLYSNKNGTQAITSDKKNQNIDKPKNFKQINESSIANRKSSQKSVNENLLKNKEKENDKEKGEKNTGKDNDKNNQINQEIDNMNNKNDIKDELIGSDDKELKATRDSDPFEKIIKADKEYKFYINDAKRNVEELNYNCNKISTTKYEFWSFLPKALFYQFSRIANFYFVLIAVIQCIPAISPLGMGTALAPIIFVFTVSLIREAVEDLQRRKLDKEQNSDIVKTYRDGSWTKILSGELEMGELIQVFQDDVFPADLLLLDSSLADGNCFIETGSLDGEKSLKVKSSTFCTKGKFCNTSQNEEKTNVQNNIKRDSSKPSSIDNSGVKINGYDNNSSDSKKKIKKNNVSPQKSEVRLIDRQNANNPGSLNMDLGMIKESNLLNENDNNSHDKENNDNNKNSNNSNNINSFSIDGNIQCDPPNYQLYELNGKANLRLNGEKTTFGFDAKNLLLKGAKLRDTEWVIGIIIYTGHNCKLMKNAKEPKLKMSSIEKFLNKLLVLIFVLQIILSIVSSILHKTFFDRHEGIIVQAKEMSHDDCVDCRFIFWIDYLMFKKSVDAFLSFFTYLLLLNTLIPISLIITLELVKIVQGIFMSLDADTFSFERKKFVKTNSVSLNEELGTVDYIFSDKTGTLTSNKMNLKFCVIGEQCFEYIRNGLTSDELKVNKKLREVEDITPFEDYDMIKISSMNTNKDNIINKLPIISYKDYALKSKNKEVCIRFDTSQKLIEEYWKSLSLCHDCNIKNGEYTGMSPDNLELVKSAKSQGFAYDVSKNSGDILINFSYGKENGNSSQQKYEKLCHIEFSSDRKRESVLVKDGSINKLYIKGADSVIEKLLDESTPTTIRNSCRKFVTKFSEQGYRTLYIAMRVLTEKETKDFIEEYRLVQMETEEKKKKLEKLFEKLENSLTLIGATIVEDKLQQNVPEVIRELREADIRIWMLTGDKLSTAHNIGLSCNLINKNMKTFIIAGKENKYDEDKKVINIAEKEEVIINFIKEYHGYIGNFEQGYLEENKSKQKFGVLIDEKALETIIGNSEIEKMFLDVAKEAAAVICCRVSPLQKSQVVKMMKNYDKSKITLAIGDGANDVSMIMEAHIGIGIYGEEGLRAAQSSDYAIGEFQILKRLLFFHGYLNLMRNSNMIIYFFYKNFVFTIIHFLYGFLNDFSGQTIIDDWFITLYNLIFTSIPLAGRGILDISLRPEDGKIVEILMPYLYKEQREYPIFTVFQFILNLVKGAGHSLINYYITINAINASIDSNGYESNLWVISVSLYTNILIIVTFDLIIFTKYHTLINWLLILIITVLLYILFLLAVQRLTIFNSFGTMKITFNSLIIWMNAIFVCGLCALIDYIILSVNTFFISSIYHKVELVSQKNNLKPNYIHGLPEDLSQKIFYNLPFYNESHKEKSKDKSEAPINFFAKNNENTNLKENDLNSIDGKKKSPKEGGEEKEEHDEKIISIIIEKENNKKMKVNNNLSSNSGLIDNQNKKKERGYIAIDDNKKKDDVRNKIHHEQDKYMKPGGINFNNNHNNKIIINNDSSKESNRMSKKMSQCESADRRLINSILPQKI